MNSISGFTCFISILYDYTYPKENETLTTEEVMEFCHNKISHLKVPHYYKLPRTSWLRLPKRSER